MQVGLHHDREQRLIDAAAPFQQDGEERPLPELRDLQSEVPGGRGQVPRAAAVAMGDAVAGPLERGGADDPGRLRIDQLLIELLGHRADAVGDIGEFEFLALKIWCQDRQSKHACTADSSHRRRMLPPR
jgi:hypothetical protein